jgi:hypothetical protein
MYQWKTGSVNAAITLQQEKKMILAMLDVSFAGNTEEHSPGEDHFGTMSNV